MIIGKLIHKKWTAYLTTKGWQCKDGDVLFLLRNLFDPELRQFYRKDTASHLPGGFETLRAAGDALGARVYFTNGLMQNKPDVLY